MAQGVMPAPQAAGTRVTGQLRREVGLTALMFISLGSIIGSGWLLGALLAAQIAGPASVLSWILGGAIIALLALIHAELGAAYPMSGGTARFPHLVFGSIPGFAAGWAAWLQAVTIAPIEVEAALTYLDKKAPGFINTDSLASQFIPAAYAVGNVALAEGACHRMMRSPPSAVARNHQRRPHRRQVGADPLKDGLIGWAVEVETADDRV